MHNKQEDRARPSDQALVASDQAALRLAPPGFDPSRMKRACDALDAVMDEPIGGDWAEHLRKCVAAVAMELFR